MNNELALTLTGEAAFAAPAKILEALPEKLTHRAVPGAPHTIYQELWHVVFWQGITLEWIAGVETPFPEKTSDPFPTQAQIDGESWSQLCRRFLASAEQAASIASNSSKVTAMVRCPSRPGHPVRVMSVQDQLISLAAHNAYHLGRIVLLRQWLGVWPPPSGGFTW